MAEGVDRNKIFVTGNSGIDGPYSMSATAWRAASFPPIDCCGLDESKKLIVVTAHRPRKFRRRPSSESVRRWARLAGTAGRRIGLSGAQKSERAGAGETGALAGLPNVHLIEPLDYVPFVKPDAQKPIC